MKSIEITAPVLIPSLSPPERLSLADNAVHVWRASLDQSPSQAGGFLNTLDDDERSKADRRLYLNPTASAYRSSRSPQVAPRPLLQQSN
jgi:hypothetical protein